MGALAVALGGARCCYLVLTGMTRTYGTAVSGSIASFHGRKALKATLRNVDSFYANKRHCVYVPVWDLNEQILFPEAELDRTDSSPKV